MSELRYEVLVNDGVERTRPERLPDGGPIISSPLATTLILGDTDAVLVDPPFTHDQIQHVGDWVAASGKKLTHIYATHGHGDHWFGTGVLFERFPDARPYATAGTIEVMRQNVALREYFWDNDFPGLIPDSPLVYQPVPAAGFDLEGHRLIPIEVGHTDTDATTVLHVPSIGLVVGGDVVYNGVHQMLLETGDGGFDAWLAALDIVEALEPRAVVAGHKNRDLPDDPAIIDQTRRYLLDARALLAGKPTPQDFFDQMTRRYPTRLNLGPVWYGAHGLLGVPLPHG
jgi:glyoxylase-like metal-dependent hydrolase (beta-lactamase superfamily II)